MSLSFRKQPLHDLDKNLRINKPLNTEVFSEINIGAVFRRIGDILFPSVKSFVAAITRLRYFRIPPVAVKIGRRVIKPSLNLKNFIPFRSADLSAARCICELITHISMCSHPHWAYSFSAPFLLQKTRCHLFITFDYLLSISYQSVRKSDYA